MTKELDVAVEGREAADEAGRRHSEVEGLNNKDEDVE